LDQFPHGSWVGMSSFIYCLFRRNLFRVRLFLQCVKLSRRRHPHVCRLVLNLLNFFAISRCDRTCL